MLARAHTFTIDGLQTRHVTVEVDIRPGLPGIRDRRPRRMPPCARRASVSTAAILNSGYEFPARRITANLAPGDVPKAGPGLDLALACAVLAASGQLPREGLDSVALFGELALDGVVRPSPGHAGGGAGDTAGGREHAALAGARSPRGGLVDDLDVTVVERLRSAVRVLSGGPGERFPSPRCSRGRAIGDGPRAAAAGLPGPDLGEVRGQHHAVQGARDRRRGRPQRAARAARRGPARRCSPSASPRSCRR